MKVMEINRHWVILMKAETHGIIPPEQWGAGGMASDETSRVFCGQVNFPEMNGGISVYGGEIEK